MRRKQFVWACSLFIGLLLMFRLIWMVAATNLLGGPPASSSVSNQLTTIPSFLYVSDVNANEAFGFTIDGNTGALVGIVGSPFSTGTSPSSVTVDPSRRFLYTANNVSSDVSAFSIDRLSGTLTPLVGSPFKAGSCPYALAVHPSGRFLYVTNQCSQDISAFTLDANGALIAIPGSPFPTGQANSVAIDASGSFLYAPDINFNHISAFRVNPATGALTAVSGSPFGTGSLPTSITVDPSGKFVYVTTSGSNNVSAYTLDAQSGALTVVPGSPFPTGTFPSWVVVEPSGRFAYVNNTNSGDISGYLIDSGTGALSPVPGSPFGGAGLTISVDASGRFLYTSSARIFAIDQSTGTLTPVPGSPSTFGILPFSVTATPGVLGFPLDNVDPQTAFTSSVFDHSQTSPYSNDMKVTAFTGETGTCFDTVNQTCRSKAVSTHFGFRNASGTAFQIAASGTYTGGGTSCAATSCTGLKCATTSQACNTFLFYDGHPGFDYRAPCDSATGTGTPVYAAGSGTVHYPSEVPTGCKGTDCEYKSGSSMKKGSAAYYHVLELDLDSPAGYKIYYLHISTYPSTSTTTTCSQAAPIVLDGTHINEGQLIGMSGNAGTVSAHLHFEVHHKDIPVDPYGWTGRLSPGSTDPYQRAINIRLWK